MTDTEAPSLLPTETFDMCKVRGKWGWGVYSSRHVDDGIDRFMCYCDDKADAERIVATLNTRPHSPTPVSPAGKEEQLRNAATHLHMIANRMHPRELTSVQIKDAAKLLDELAAGSRAD